MHPLAANLFHECFGMLLVSKTEAVHFRRRWGLALPSLALAVVIPQAGQRRVLQAYQDKPSKQVIRPPHDIFEQV
jgi:hypothetical protein